MIENLLVIRKIWVNRLDFVFTLPSFCFALQMLLLLHFIREKTKDNL